MKNKTIFIVLAILFLPFVLKAQSIQLINSTLQSWSGGVAGRTGENYTFVIAFHGCSTDPIPDTIWIGQEPICIGSQGKNYQENAHLNVSRSPNTVQFEINVGTARDENHNLPNTNNTELSTPPHPPIPYKGIALLSYKYKGERRYYLVSKIMKVYPPIAYP